MAGGARQCRAAVLAAAFVCALFSLGGCASNSYFGIPLSAGAADARLQGLARRARAGEREAQLELGREFERRQDLGRAERLYLRASLDRGGTRFLYSPPQRGNRAGGTVPVSQGARTEGLAAARQAWIRVRSERLAQRAAERAAPELSLDVYVATRFAIDQQLGVIASAAFQVQDVAGPTRAVGPFVMTGEGHQGGEACDAIEALVTRYRDYGFQDCRVQSYIRRSDQREFHVVRYSDEYQQSQEYTSSSIREFYREPFASVPGLGSYGEICGSFAALAIRVRSNRVYTLLLVPERRPQDDANDAASCN